MAPAAGRNTKSTAEAETALVLTPVSAGPWRPW
jgi:hypothetical protein